MFKKSRKKSILTLLFGLLSVIFGIIFAVQILFMGVFPLKLAIPLLLICIILPILFFLLYCFVTRRKIFKIINSVLIFCLMITFGAGNYLLHSANKTLENVTELTDKTTHKISLITLPNYTGISDIKELKGKNVGTISALDEEGTEKALEEIQDQVEINVLNYDTLASLIEAMYNGEVSAIVMNEAFRSTAQDMGDIYYCINTDGVVLNQTVYYTDKDNDAVPPDTVNVTKEPFTILVSGNDNFGTLNEYNRSDVNMLLTINPQTATVLVTNISRDSYVPIACAADTTSDDCLDGAYDKLTHTGLNGVATTEKSIENYFGVDINYNVRLNFSSFQNIVDAMGGIDVYVEEGCEVDTFYVNGTQGVTAGWNHLDGKRALGFVRERKAYTDGTAQRVRNQQEAIRALISKVGSLDTVVNFNKILNAINSAFETNMSADEIKQLIRFEFANLPDWTVEGYSLRVDGDYQYSAYLMADAYVDIPLDDSVEYLREKIQAVLDGKSSTTIVDPEEAAASGSYDSETQAAIIEEGMEENEMY